MLVLEDAPIVISAEGFLDLRLGIFVVCLKPIFKGIVILCAFLSVPLNPDIIGGNPAAVFGECAEHSHLAETFPAPSKRIP